MVKEQPGHRASIGTHLKRAFGWNLGRMTPTEGERAALGAAGVKDPAVQRYAVWRRSLLLVAFVPTLLAAVLGLLDAWEDGFDEYTLLGTLLEVGWLVAACALPVAAWLGIRGWARPGTGARALRAAWLFSFLLPLVYALLPTEAVMHVEPLETPAVAVVAAERAAEAAEMEDVDVVAKLEAVQAITVEFVLSGAAFLLLLPAILSLIPGAVNGCLRIKAALPAAQLPGWLLVTVAPAFLLFWLVMFVLVSPAVEGVWLALGILLWAGAPLVFALNGRVLVQSQIGAEEAARIARVKRTVGFVALAGIACMLLFVLTTKVAGLHLLGTDEDRAFAGRLEELGDSDDEVGLDDIRTAYGDSTSFLYALDLASVRFVIDLLAKLLLVTAVFADLILRATLSAWRNDRALRARAESPAYDASAAAADDALGRGAPASARG